MKDQDNYDAYTARLNKEIEELKEQLEEARRTTAKEILKIINTFDWKQKDVDNPAMEMAYDKMGSAVYVDMHNEDLESINDEIKRKYLGGKA